jgi:hypothetical protein
MFGKRYTFSEFVNLTGAVDAKGNKQLYYVRNEMILSRTLAGDIVRPMFISKALRARHTGLTVWPSFDDRRPEFSNRERYVCVVSGIEEFRLVSPVFKQNLYSGVLEELRPNETPLDFFKNVNASQFPLFNDAKVLRQILTPGDCLFIPAFYWSQSMTHHEDPSDMSVFVTFEYESHSEMLNLLFEAIDQGVLEN